MLLRVDQGKFTAKITQVLDFGERLPLLWGDIDIAATLLLLEIESRMHVRGGLSSPGSRAF